MNGSRKARKPNYTLKCQSPTYKPLLLGCITSKNAIEKLSQVYYITSEIAKQTLWQKFFDHTMSPRQSMASYLAYIELLAKQLRDEEETK